MFTSCPITPHAHTYSHTPPNHPMLTWDNEGNGEAEGEAEGEADDDDEEEEEEDDDDDDDDDDGGAVGPRATGSCG